MSCDFRLYALKTIELDDRKKTRTKDAVQKEARYVILLNKRHFVKSDVILFTETSVW